MHIPDGYLSPSTCAVLYAGAVPGWYGALRRIRRTLTARMIPLISVFAAFSFRPHDVQPAAARRHDRPRARSDDRGHCCLGRPERSCRVSIAIAIQALFFGDGGITTLGANCFNMAIVGSLVAYATYRVDRLRARRSPRDVGWSPQPLPDISPPMLRRFVTAIEFGIQPMLFHDARGVPLYAPYTLSVAVPAMMIGHLAIAGVAEAVDCRRTGRLPASRRSRALAKHVGSRA